MVDNNMEPWILFFKTLLDMPPPGKEGVKTEEYDQARNLNRTLFWKTKGRVAKTCFRMFIEYADPNKVEDKPIVRGFSTEFQQKYTIPLLESMMKILFSQPQNFVGAKCLIFTIKYIEASARMDQTLEKIKPYIDQIIYDIILPMMYITKQDNELFEEDPQEYVRCYQEYDETLFCPKIEVQGLLTILVSYCSDKNITKGPDGKYAKKMPDNIQKFMAYAVKEFDVYEKDKINWRKKESLMYAIGSIREHNDKVDELETQLE